MSRCAISLIIGSQICTSVMSMCEKRLRKGKRLGHRCRAFATANLPGTQYVQAVVIDPAALTDGRSLTGAHS